MKSHISIFLVIVTITAAFTNFLDNRIMNGHEVAIFQAPYQVSIHIYKKFQCGGSILSHNFIITAAQCTCTHPINKTTVRAGSSFRSKGGQVVQVKRKFEHPNYNSNGSHFDVAILLVQSLKLSKRHNALPVSLPLSGRTWPASTVVTVSGWGNSESSENVVYLRRAKTLLIDSDQCKSLLKENNDVTEEMMCTFDKKKRAISCLGDGGGPLVLQNSYTLVGLVAWGIGDCNNEFPEIYTRVAHPEIRDFITERTGL